MNTKLIFFIIAVAIYLVALPNIFASRVPPIVTYTYQGNQQSLQGQLTANGYRYNEGASKKVSLATLDWPPYIGEDLCNKGWVFQFAVALLVSKGYQVDIHFYPWARSVKMVERGKIDILFPEYFIEASAPSDTYTDKKRIELLALSNKYPGGEVAFLKRRNESVKFDGDLNSLKGLTIGVVRGYQNTPEFDAMMDAKFFNTIQAVDELQLMKLLVNKRVELIVGDPRVFFHTINYSSLSNNNKQAIINGMEVIKPALKYNSLYFAVSLQSTQWKQLIDDINLALIEFELSKETDNIIKNGSGCIAEF